MHPTVAARSLLLTAPHTLEWVEETLPEPHGDEVLVQTTSGAISIGSELPLYLGTARSSVPARYPRMTGYESIGMVSACGPETRGLRVGQRVAAFYGHRTVALVSEAKVLALPDGVSDRLALLAILTCDAAKGVRSVAPLPEEPVLVTGAGAMGLLTLFILRAYGVAAVDVVEPKVSRHTLAQALGARVVLTPEEFSEQAGEYAAAFECSSRNAAFVLLQERLRPTGRLCVSADGNHEPLTLAPAFHEKELRIFGSSDGWDYHAHSAWYFDLLRRQSTSLSEIFQYSVASSDLPETFARLAGQEIEPVKVFVEYRSGTTRREPGRARCAVQAYSDQP